MNSELESYIGKELDGNDHDFCRRVWTTDKDIYLNRLKAIGFTDKQHVLDAGCGLGQWTDCISKLNNKVTGIEYSDARYKFCNGIKNILQQENVDYVQGSIEELPFENESFDAIFSYSVVHCTDYRKSLKEFYRVLKPDGVLYFNTNGIGWFIYNLVDGHNKTENFDPRQMAIDTITNSLSYYSEGIYSPGKFLATPKNTILKDLAALNFTTPIIGDEGTVKVNNIQTKSFFKGEYYNEEGIFEVLVRK